jgi:hypothetical protein
MRRLLSTLLAVALSAVCLWFLLTPDVLRSIGRLATDARPMPILGALLLVALLQWLRAWRFAVMATGRLGLPDATMVRISLQLTALNFILPFRLGELSFPVLMRRHYGHGFLHATGVLLLARLFDLATVAAILLGAAAWLRVPVGVPYVLPAFCALVLAVAPFGLALAGQALRPWLARLPHVGHVADRLTAAFDAIRDHRAAILAVGLGFAMWLVFGLAAILTAGAVVGTVGPVAAMLGGAAGNIAFALPVNGIAGIGPAQAAWVAAVTQAGVPWNDAVLSALALHAVVLVNALLLGALATIPALGKSDRQGATPVQ